MIIRFINEKPGATHEYVVDYIDTDAITFFSVFEERVVVHYDEDTHVIYNSLTNYDQVVMGIHEWERLENSKCYPAQPSHDQFNRLDYTLIGMAIGWLITCSIWQFFS